MAQTGGTLNAITLRDAMRGMQHDESLSIRPRVLHVHESWMGTPEWAAMASQTGGTFPQLQKQQPKKKGGKRG